MKFVSFTRIEFEGMSVGDGYRGLRISECNMCSDVNALGALWVKKSRRTHLFGKCAKCRKVAKGVGSNFSRLLCAAKDVEVTYV